MSAVEILRELVAIDSTSARSNLPMIDALDRHARGLGFSTRRQAWTDPAGVPKANLIASRGGETGGLALVGHTDCVPFDRDWSTWRPDPSWRSRETVPAHRPVKRSTLAHILKQARLSVAKFLKLL